MTNAEARMTKEVRMPEFPKQLAKVFNARWSHLRFVILSSLWFRSFVIPFRLTGHQMAAGIAA